MDYINFTISIVALILAIVGFPMLYEYLKSKASKSLLAQIRVRPLYIPQSIGDATYWLIELTTCAGCLLVYIMKPFISKRVRIRVTFESENYTYEAPTYEFQRAFGLLQDGIIEIKPNTIKNIAIACRLFREPLCTFGGSFGVQPLSGDCDAIISVWDADLDRVSSRHKIIQYVQQGNPTIDEKNKNAV